VEEFEGHEDDEGREGEDQPLSGLTSRAAATSAGLPPRAPRNCWKRRRLGRRACRPDRKNGANAQRPGAVATAFALGLQAALDTGAQEPAIIMETSGEPPTDLPVEAQLEQLGLAKHGHGPRWLLTGDDATSGWRATTRPRTTMSGAQQLPTSPLKVRLRPVSCCASAARLRTGPGQLKTRPSQGGAPAKVGPAFGADGTDPRRRKAPGG